MTLRICCKCKTIMGEAKGYYPAPNGGEAEFTHGYCPECADELYRELCKMVVNGKAVLTTKEEGRI